VLLQPWLLCGTIAIYLHTICADDPLPILFTTSEIAEVVFVVSSTATMVLLTKYYVLHTTYYVLPRYYYYCCTKPLTPRQQLLNARTMRKRAFSLEPHSFIHSYKRKVLPSSLLEHSSPLLLSWLLVGLPFK
jgi:hypothetical protein